MSRTTSIGLALLVLAVHAVGPGGTCFVEVTRAAAQERDELAEQGKRLLVDQGCHGCHTIESTGTPIGPDLSRIGAKYAEPYLEAWLADPSAQKPLAHMPRVALTDRRGEGTRRVPQVAQPGGPSS